MLQDKWIYLHDDDLFIFNGFFFGESSLLCLQWILFWRVFLKVIFLVNRHRKDEDLPSVTDSAIISCIKRLNVVEKSVTKRPQGSYDEKSKISRARYLWALQMAVRTQLPCSEQAVKEYMDTLNAPNCPEMPQALPDYLDAKKLSLVHFSDIAFFDETHRKACPGSADKNSVAILSSKKSVFRVPRTNGQPDPINGKIEDYNVSQSYVKYTDEGRFCLGVCVDVVKDEAGNKDLVGKRLAMFDYTGKLILSAKVFDERIQQEILRVQSLKNGGQWVTGQNNQQDYDCYHDDKVSKIKGIGKVTSQMFHTNGIYTLKDLLNLTDEQIHQMDNMPTRKCLEWRDNAITMFKGRSAEFMLRPGKIDHRKTSNPYKSRYGDSWLQKLKQSSHLSNVCDVRDLVEYIVGETKHAGKKYFYHDALSLLTSKCTMKWMERMGYLKMWFRPEQGLFEDHPDLKRYYGRVVGNSPELMPLDKRLNKDIHESVNQHYIATNDLPKEDSRRFGLETPKQVSRSYERLWDPNTGVAPSPERVATDVERVFSDAIPRIIRARGKCLDDNNVKGNRHNKSSIKSAKWGGRRKRLLALDNYGKYQFHKDCELGLAIKLEKAKADFTGIKNESALKKELLPPLKALEDSMADALGYTLKGDGESQELVFVGKDPIEIIED